MYWTIPLEAARAVAMVQPVPPDQPKKAVAPKETTPARVYRILPRPTLIDGQNPFGVPPPKPRDLYRFIDPLPIPDIRDFGATPKKQALPTRPQRHATPEVVQCRWQSLAEGSRMLFCILPRRGDPVTLRNSVDVPTDVLNSWTFGTTTVLSIQK